MGTYNQSQIEIIKKLQEKEISLFTLPELKRLFALDNQQTAYKIIQRLTQKGIIKRIISGKYLFLLRKPNEFTIANFLYQPSYISLESALSFYGMITGFPYQITSMTTKKTKLYVFEGKAYGYTQIVPSLFWGYEKKENFLIADREKNLIDFLYLAFKGQRILKSEKVKSQFDLTEIDKKKLKSYFKKVRNPAFLSYLCQAKIC